MLYGHFGSYLGLSSQEIYCGEIKFRRRGIFDPYEGNSKDNGIGVEFLGKITSYRKTQRQETWFNTSAWLDIMIQGQMSREVSMDKAWRGPDHRK